MDDRYGIQRGVLLRAPLLFHRRERPVSAAQDFLKAEIDEDAWASLYSTVSRPFPRPESGKIAVKVINDYGDEVMKVFEV